MTGGPGLSDRGIFHCTCTVGALVMKAFELQRCQIPGYASLPTDTFEVSAKVPEGTTQEQFLVMIQSLLKDRFGRDFGHAGLMNFNGPGEVSGQPSDDGRTRLETPVRTIIKKAPAVTWVGTVTTAGHPRQTMRQALLSKKHRQRIRNSILSYPRTSALIRG
jgi:Protein of unknown function (DUF3738)